MDYSTEQRIKITEAMHKHFQQLATVMFSKLGVVVQPGGLDFTRSGVGYADVDMNMMWAGYQFSTLNVVNDVLVPQKGLLTRYKVKA